MTFVLTKDGGKTDFVFNTELRDKEGVALFKKND